MTKTEIKKIAEMIYINQYVTEYQVSIIHRIDDNREDHQKAFNALKAFCKEKYDFEVTASSFFLKEDGYATIVFREDADFAYDFDKLKFILKEELKKISNNF